MATIYPFRGFRYDQSKVDDLAKVVTQPYDKIPETLRLDYLERSQYNIVRVIKNPDYEQAADALETWIGSAVLVQDPTPSIYVYEQQFEYEGECWVRLGCIGLVSLEDEDLVVKGHERVLDKPLEDRLNLIRSTEANEGLVFTLYSDPELKLDLVLREFTEGRPPDMELVDDFGVTNRLWCMKDSESLDEVKRALTGKSLYIADGHHRFKTSVSYHRECLDKGWRPTALESFDKRMVALFNMESEGMRILATHRAIKNLSGLEIPRLLEKLSVHFKVQEASSAEHMFRSVESASQRIGLLSGSPSRAHVIELSQESLDNPDFMPSIKGPSRGLDVNLLHEGILRPLLGLGAQEVASQEYVEYFRDRAAMLKGVEEGRFQLGFVLHPTSLQQVRDVSEYGVKMPQKSTDFFPKLLTGLVLMKMEVDKSEGR